MDPDQLAKRADGLATNENDSKGELDNRSESQKAFQPIKSSRSRSQGRPDQSLASSRRETSRGSGGQLSLQHSRSYGDGHGFVCFSGNDRHAEDGMPTEDDAENKAFEVQWEGGDDDPTNPRSMSRLRKWIIVLVVSSSSACV